jgi:hypothetical protein
VLLSTLQVLLDRGFTIQFLEETESFDRENLPAFLGTQLAIYADIAHMESKAKSDFSTANWDKRRRLATERKEPFTSECPNWLRVVDGKYEVISERAHAIRTIFELARDGWGIGRLVRYANENGLAAPGKVGTWHTSLVNRILSNEALIGRFQAKKVVNGKRVAIGEPIDDYFPVVIDPAVFHAVQIQRARVAVFPKRRDENNFNYLMGIAECSCGGTWRRMNKNSGKQAGYAIYSCSNRVRGSTDCANVPAKAFDFQFVSFACSEIPPLLAMADDPTRNRREAIDLRLKALGQGFERLLALAMDNADLKEEVAGKLRALKEERGLLKAELNKLQLLQLPKDGFSFEEGVGVFIPSFLDWYVSGTEEAENAFRARAIFATRIREAVASVVVDKSRSFYTVQLKNGKEERQALYPDIVFRRVEECLPAEEIDEAFGELSRTRKASLELVGRLGAIA